MKNLDICKKICNHLIGDNHTDHHKLIIGTLVIILGILIDQFFQIFEYRIIHYFGSITVCLVHGIGAVPYVEMLLKIGKNGI